ncbi:MAG: hypothetical protein WAZ27_04245 [Minisyncoccia bacterium]
MVLHEGGDYREMISSELEPSAAVPTPEAPMPKHEWVRAHPFLATTVTLVSLLVFGTFLVAGRVDVNPSNESGAWGGAGGIFSNAGRRTIALAPREEPRLQTQEDSYATLPIFKPTVDGATTTPGDEDFISILASLVQATPVTSKSTEPEVPGSYVFIPQGLISTEPQTKKQTAQQAALHSYGNEVGTYVKSHEDTHTNSTPILKDHIEDRTNELKQRAVRNLGDDMKQLGVALREMADVPASAKGMHAAYAGAYITAGSNLMKVADTTTDEEFVAAVAVYNTSIESLSNRFQMLVILFGANEVTFSSSDQGSLFTFSPTLSLSQ